MSVISVIVHNSREEIISGIPKSVSITTNIPSTIFYTLDGSEPNTFSNIYTGTLFLPFNVLTLTLKILATNGVNSSPVVVECYQSSITQGNVRGPRVGTDAQPGSNVLNDYPFGTPPYQPNQTFNNNVGITVDDPSKPEIIQGYGADGYANSFTNKPYNSLNYQIIYNNTNQIGQLNKDQLPSNVKFKPVIAPPEEDQQINNNLFDPRALVIFQDFDNQNPNDPVQLNRANFTLDDIEKDRDGALLLNTSLESPPPSGSFIKSFYNARTGNSTYYYRDSVSNRWIISTAKFVPTGSYDGNLSSSASAFGGRVYEWLPFTRRILF